MDAEHDDGYLRLTQRLDRRLLRRHLRLLDDLGDEAEVRNEDHYMGRPRGGWSLSAVTHSDSTQTVTLRATEPRQREADEPWISMREMFFGRPRES